MRVEYTSFRRPSVDIPNHKQTVGSFVCSDYDTFLVRVRYRFYLVAVALEQTLSVVRLFFVVVIDDSSMPNTVEYLLDGIFLARPGVFFLSGEVNGSVHHLIVEAHGPPQIERLVTSRLIIVAGLGSIVELPAFVLVFIELFVFFLLVLVFFFTLPIFVFILIVLVFFLILFSVLTTLRHLVAHPVGPELTVKVGHFSSCFDFVTNLQKGKN